MIRKPLSNRFAARFISAALAIVLLLAGMGAASAQTTPPPPPDRYGDWRHPEKALPLPVIQGGLQTQSSPSLQDCISSRPNALDWSVLVATALNVGIPNGDIYIKRGVCSNSTPVRLTTDPGWETAARLNRDATQVVYMSDHTGNYDVYIMSSTGAGQTNLTNSPYYEGQPSFSGIDSHIVFVSDRYGDPDIYTMNPDGSGKVQLTSGPDVDVEPDWSPDGKQITFAREIPNSNLGVIYVMNADGTNLHAITPPLPFANRPVWSPSGTRIAFGYDFDGDYWFDLAIINADGSGLYAVPIYKAIDPYTDFYNGSWLSDESGLLFSGFVYTISPDTYKFTISAYNAYQVEFSNNTIAREIKLGLDATFTPYTRGLDITPPVSSLAALPEYSRSDSIPLNWTVSDNYSGPAWLSFQYYASWIPTFGTYNFEVFSTPQLPTQTGQMIVSGMPGTKASFRVQAVDFANNSEPPKNAEVSTWLYKWQLTARVTDTRERPLAGASVALTPAAMLPLKTGADGSALTYTTYDLSTFKAVVSKPGYATLSTQSWEVYADSSYINALPGTGEQIVNGQFEDTSNPAPNNPMAGWTASGGAIIGPASMQGSKAAFIRNPQTAQAARYGLGQPVAIPADMNEPTLSFYYYGGGGAQSHLKAIFTPQGETAVTLFDRAGVQHDWTHAWVDLTPYLGKTGMLEFVLEKAANDNYYSVYLGQVSLASAQGLTIDQVSPLRVAAPLASDLTVDVWGTNFQAVDMLTYGGNSTPFTLLDSTHLTFVIPAGTDAGPYPVRLQAGIAEITSPQPVFIGSFLYLPFTFQR